MAETADIDDPDDADETEPNVPEGAAVFPLIPAELGVHPLLLAVLHAVIFLEGSAEQLVQPEAAAEALEDLATYLQRLTGPELLRLREDLDSMTAYARQQVWPKQQIHFLRDFMASFGIEAP